MTDARAGDGSPIARHTSTPQELKERLAVERTGQAHVVYRDAGGRQVIRVLSHIGATVRIGRREECEVCIDWDPEVSRLHAELHLAGHDWTVLDDGLSRNGSFVNGTRLQGRRRLRDGDTVVVGQTSIVFRAPIAIRDRTTRPGRSTQMAIHVGPTDRRLLVALCRPLRDPSHTLPASNQAIADEMCVTVAAVKRRLSGLFTRFEIAHLPQSEKRTRLAVMALQSGLVTSRDLLAP